MSQLPNVSKTQSRIVLALALVAAAWVRWVGVESTSLWLDELVSYWIISAESPWELIWDRALLHSNTPPLFFLFEGASVAILGPSELAMRLPSLVAGLATVASLYWFGRQLFSRPVGATAGVIGALNPYQIFYSQDGRPYQLAVLLAAWSVYLLIRYVQEGRRFYLVAHGVTLVAALYTHYVCLFLVALDGLYFTGHYFNLSPDRRPSYRWWAAVEALAVVAFAPGLWALARIWTVRSELAYVKDAPALSDAFQFFGPTWLAVSLVAVAVILAPVAGRIGRRLDHEAGRYLGRVFVVVLWFAIPMAVLLAVATWLQPTMFHVRYRLPFSVPCMLLTAALIGGVRPAWVRHAWLLAYAVLALAATPGVRLPQGPYSDHGLYEDWRYVAAVLDKDSQPGELVVMRNGLVESELLVDRPDDPVLADYVACPLGSFYVRRPRPVISLPRDLRPTPARRAAYETYFKQHVIPALRQAPRFKLVVRIDDVGDYSSTYYRDLFERWLERLGGPAVRLRSVAQNGTLVVARYEVNGQAQSAAATRRRGP